ncbi:hypothetical protein HYH03_000945 [Edaphochlamys debaryana]|uniref:Uncharacterized protein n=1 Tax=Edaphochlamys debaryana TaxID=47281 RepID=A0A835YG56_9CHLO|nr:hypothetical protein HYH03_000945 [Edaphochlamys debaryana]|eukprot:KAG2501127.1 hypothetical protein HYH03_000945 [Edaphochlamys debaryana]
MAEAELQTTPVSNVQQPPASAEALRAVAVERGSPTAPASAPASEAVQEEAQEEKKEKKETPPMRQEVAEAIIAALQQLHSVKDSRAVIAANAAAKIPTVVAIVSAEAVTKLGAKMAPLLIKAATQGAAVYKVVVEAKDLAKGAERTCPHAALVHSLKIQGRLLLPALLVTGGRDAGRCLSAGGIDEWEQVLMDAMHRDAKGVAVCGTPLMG